MSAAYDLHRSRPGHPVPDTSVALVAGAAVLGVWLGRQPITMLVAGVLAGHLALWHRKLVFAMVVAATVCLAAYRSDQQWMAAHPRHLGVYTGWAQVMADPAAYGSGLRVTVQIQGERYDTWLYGARRNRPGRLQAGQYVWVQGERTPLRRGARRAALRHVVGRFRADVLADVHPGSPITRASNRVRDRLRSAADTAMDPVHSALFTGLVLGDDAREPGWLLDAFRGAGLSHLTAVSGQNVGFVLLAAMPLLRRLRSWWRWAATVGLIIWFMALTRFEPSVLRAGVMAALSATAQVRGRQAQPVRLLSLAVSGLVVLDPFLVWSVGFWLSVAATAGVCLVAPWCQPRLPGPPWLRLPLSVTLGAQVGVSLPSLLVFHRLPLVSVPANLAAVPVAGMVMLYGIPSALLAPVLPGALGRAVMLPDLLGTRWVASVAQVAAATEPAPVWGAAGWAVLVGVWCTYRLRRRRRSRVTHAVVPS